MFRTILNFELKYWLKNPVPYIFSIILFGLAFLTMWGMSSEAETVDNVIMMNSYNRLNNLANMFSLLLIFLLPAIMGNSMFRDYDSRMYTLLYSYPFVKRNYYLAKFSSAFLVTSLVSLVLVSGFLLGAQMPGIPKEVMLPFDPKRYLHLLFFFVLPNMFIFGSVIFSIIVFTRNIYLSFIAVILMIMVKGFGSGVLGENGFDMAAALIDPMGEAAVKQYTQYWTLEDKNFNVLPIGGSILLNRILWLTMSIALLVWTYVKFHFTQFTRTSSNKKKEDGDQKVYQNKVEQIDIPLGSIDFSLPSQLRTSWHLSTIDFRSIVFSWPFLSLLLAGFMLVLFQQYQMSPEDGIVKFPTTANMLRVPMFIFSGTINLLTFLYVGILMFKGKMSRMDGLIDATPQSNWVILFSRFLAIAKMHFVLLTLVMLGGVAVQLISNYTRVEFWHYAFELYILHGLHFTIWSCLAFCIHSVSRNMYIGYFLLILIPIILIFVPSIADYLGFDLLKENICQYNTVKGQFIGFEYSDFNGYGAQIVNYFAYKLYWLLVGFVLLLIGLLGWRRGLTFSIGERLELARMRLKSGLLYPLLFGIFAFVSMGSTIYYQEHYVSKVSFSSKQQNDLSAHNEKNYGHLFNLNQPQLRKIDMYMDIYPQTKDFKSGGHMTFVNEIGGYIDTIVIAKSFKEITECTVLSAHELIVEDEDMHYTIVRLDEALELGDSLHISFTVKNHPNTFLHHNSRIVSNGTYMQSRILPTLGIRDAFIKSEEDRAHYGLEEYKERDLTPGDTSLTNYTFRDNASIGMIDYECELSTDESQSAITMGILLSQSIKDGRRHYHYKSKEPIVSSISWLSGVYEKVISQNQYQALEMYRHPWHDQNDEHYFNGMSTSLDYCSQWFGPLTFDTMKIVAFPVTQGTYATVNGNVIPYSESYFHCDVHDHNNERFNMPFYVSAHEIAHCWWGHKVDPANIKGGRMISEGMAEYLAMKSIQKKYGDQKLHEFRKKYHGVYLEERGHRSDETALIFAGLDMDYLNYRKTALSLISISDYIGEERLNTALAEFAEEFQNTSAPFPTTIDFVEAIRNATPDSLKYLVHDMFETISFYDNAIENIAVDKKDDVYLITGDLYVTKYRADKKGKRLYEDNALKLEDRQSIALNDYVSIRCYGVDGTILFTKMLKVKEIKNALSFSINEMPHRIEIDPDYLYMDVNRDDDVWSR